jgi:Phosphoheptose isomerase
MKNNVVDIYNKLFERYPGLVVCKKDILDAFDLLNNCYSQGDKVLICGNGGSACDSEHIVGELMKGFLLKREMSEVVRDKFKKAIPENWEYLSQSLQGALPAISLVSQTGISTAVSNDVAGDMTFAQQVYGYAKKGDVIIGVSTSGNAKNVVNALNVAKVMEMNTIGLTGVGGGMMGKICDVTIKVPEKETYLIQEYHLPVYHTLCAMLEMQFFG